MFFSIRVKKKCIVLLDAKSARAICGKVVI